MRCPAGQHILRKIFIVGCAVALGQRITSHYASLLSLIWAQSRELAAYGVLWA
jgi:hypothetical protein